jgi:hypothetical protein
MCEWHFLSFTVRMSDSTASIPSSVSLRLTTRSIDALPGFAANVVNKYFDGALRSVQCGAKQLQCTIRLRSKLRRTCETTALIASFTRRTRGSFQLFARSSATQLTLHQYLDCPSEWIWPNVATNGSIPQQLHCPNASSIAALQAAIMRGDITWHAYPFNGESELLDPSLFGFGFDLTHSLVRISLFRLCIPLSTSGRAIRLQA